MGCQAAYDEPSMKTAFKLLTVALLLGCFHLHAETKAPAVVIPTHTRTDDVVYGRKFGVALTLDVITPEKPNVYGIVYMVGGG